MQKRIVTSCLSLLLSERGAKVNQVLGKVLLLEGNDLGLNVGGKLARPAHQGLLRLGDAVKSNGGDGSGGLTGDVSSNRLIGDCEMKVRELQQTLLDLFAALPLDCSGGANRVLVVRINVNALNRCKRLGNSGEVANNLPNGVNLVREHSRSESLEKGRQVRAFTERGTKKKKKKKKGKRKLSQHEPFFDETWPPRRFTQLA